jgi:solute carrier family 45 protein 1/2/4
MWYKYSIKKGQGDDALNQTVISLFRARNVYVSGLLLDSLGMLMLAVTKNRYTVIIFSAAAGVLYSTLFTMPYLLVAHYHALGTVSQSC